MSVINLDVLRKIIVTHNYVNLINPVILGYFIFPSEMGSKTSLVQLPGLLGF